MLDVIIAVREPGRLKPDWSGRFELPEIPAVGSYITINRPGEAAPWGEEMIVKKIWWMLFNPNAAKADGGREPRGQVKQIVVVCEAALGPFSTKAWRKAHEGRSGVQTFEVSRFSWKPDRDAESQTALARKLMGWPGVSKFGKKLGPVDGGKS